MKRPPSLPDRHVCQDCSAPLYDRRKTRCTRCREKLKARPVGPPPKPKKRKPRGQRVATRRYQKKYRLNRAWEQAKTRAAELRAAGEKAKAADLHQRRCTRCKRIVPASRMSYVPKTQSPDCRGGVCADCSPTENVQYPWAIRLAAYRRKVAARIARRRRLAGLQSQP
jgi:hypothetical protein